MRLRMVGIAGSATGISLIPCHDVLSMSNAPKRCVDRAESAVSSTKMSAVIAHCSSAEPQRTMAGVASCMVSLREAIIDSTVRATGPSSLLIPEYTRGQCWRGSTNRVMVDLLMFRKNCAGQDARPSPKHVNR
jgi:hypothetical protein